MSVPRTAFLRVAALTGATVAVGTLSGMFSEEKLNFLYKDQLHLSADGLATLGILLGLPAYLRPLMGAWSDLIPFFGYHRRSYYALAALFSAAGFFGLSRLSGFHYATVALLALVAGLGSELGMLMADAVMVEAGNQTGTVGRLQALQQFLPPVLLLCGAAHYGGYVTAHWSYQRCFTGAALASLLAAPLAWLIAERREPRRSPQETEAERANRQATRQKERAATVAALRGAARSPGLWVLVGFLFYMIVTPSADTAQFYYSVDTLHFSKQFLGDLNIYQSAGTILGTLTFAALSRRLSARIVVWGAWTIGCGSYLLFMGLHDPTSAKVIAFLTAYLSIAYELGLYLLAAQACPPGVEGTVYGLFIAAISLGEALSDKFGSSLYDFFGPGRPGHHYTTTHGWFAALWCGFGFTLLAAAFIPFLPEWARSKAPLPAASES